MTADPVKTLVARFLPTILETYRAVQTPLADTCAVLIQDGTSALIFVCPSQDVVATLVQLSGGETWPELAAYAEERLRTTQAAGLLRVIVATDQGFGAARVLDGGAA